MLNGDKEGCVETLGNADGEFEGTLDGLDETLDNVQGVG
jgi:hypothetical protein